MIGIDYSLNLLRAISYNAKKDENKVAGEVGATSRIQIR